MDTWINTEKLEVAKSPYNGWFYLDGTWMYALFNKGKIVAKMIRILK